MELSQLSSLAQFVGAVGLVVLLPALQRLGVGRATLIALALLTTTVQMAMWASLSVSSVRNMLGKAGYDALPYIINGAGIMVGVLMPCIRATIATLADTNQMKASVAVANPDFCQAFSTMLSRKPATMAVDDYASCIAGQL
jgi:hypothetical protein